MSRGHLIRVPKVYELSKKLSTKRLPKHILELIDNLPEKVDLSLGISGFEPINNVRNKLKSELSILKKDIIDNYMTSEKYVFFLDKDTRDDPFFEPYLYKHGYTASAVFGFGASLTISALSIGLFSHLFGAGIASVVLLTGASAIPVYQTLSYSFHNIKMRNAPLRYYNLSKLLEEIDRIMLHGVAYDFSLKNRCESIGLITSDPIGMTVEDETHVWMLHLEMDAVSDYLRMLLDYEFQDKPIFMSMDKLADLRIDSIMRSKLDSMINLWLSGTSSIEIAKRIHRCLNSERE